MANITIHEFNSENLDSQGELRWPADKTTTVADSATHALDPATKCIVLTADAAVRVSFTGAAAVSSGMPVIATVPNFFKLNLGRAGGNLKFVVG